MVRSGNSVDNLYHARQEGHLADDDAMALDTMHYLDERAREEARAPTCSGSVFRMTSPGGLLTGWRGSANLWPAALILVPEVAPCRSEAMTGLR